MLRNYSHLPYAITATTARFLFRRSNSSYLVSGDLGSLITRRQTADLSSSPDLANDEPQTTSVLTITPRASERFKYLLERRKMEKGAVQLSVREKGCAGLSYTMDFHQSADVAMGNGQSGILVTQNDGYSLIVDRKSLGYLLGCEIDWLEGDVSCQFVFKNPNASRNCSCGRSFAA